VGVGGWGSVKRGCVLRVYVLLLWWGKCIFAARTHTPHPKKVKSKTHRRQLRPAVLLRVRDVLAQQRLRQRPVVPDLLRLGLLGRELGVEGHEGGVAARVAADDELREARVVDRVDDVADDAHAVKAGGVIGGGG
jgi:hypothetical protein